jgi:hypothetical protein
MRYLNLLLPQSWIHSEPHAEHLKDFVVFRSYRKRGAGAREEGQSLNQLYGHAMKYKAWVQKRFF